MKSLTKNEAFQEETAGQDCNAYSSRMLSLDNFIKKGMDSKQSKTHFEKMIESKDDPLKTLPTPFALKVYDLKDEKFKH